MQELHLDADKTNACLCNVAVSKLSFPESREIPAAHCTRDDGLSSLNLSKDKMLPLVSQAWFWGGCAPATLMCLPAVSFASTNEVYMSCNAAIYG